MNNTNRRNNNKKRNNKKKNSSRKQVREMYIPRTAVDTRNNFMIGATNMPLAQMMDKKRKQGAKKNKRRANNAIKTKEHIHDCSLLYASAICDPFGTGSGACLPFGFPVASQKYKAYARTSMVLGTTGYGFVLIQPVLDNTSNALTVTTATSVGGNTTSFNSFTNTTTANLARLPYTATQLNNGLYFGRLVSVGARIRYTGTEANRNGVVSCYEDPNHAAVLGMNPQQVSGTQITANQRPQPDGAWHALYSSGPVFPFEIEFTNSTNNPSLQFMCISVQGLAGDTYEVEICEHVEYIGQSVNDVSPSHADPVGYGIVIENVKTTLKSSPLTRAVGKLAFDGILNMTGTRGYVRTVSALADSISPYLLGDGDASSAALTEL